MTEEQQKLLQRLYTEHKLTESNVGLLRQQLDFTQIYLNNYRTGLQVLKEIETKKAEEEMLMNVGGSIFVQARLINPEKVTRSLGSGVVMEQNVEEAKKAVENAISRLEEQYQRTAENYEKMVARLTISSSQIQDLMANIQKEEEKRSV